MMAVNQQQERLNGETTPSFVLRSRLCENNTYVYIIREVPFGKGVLTCAYIRTCSYARAHTGAARAQAHQTKFTSRNTLVKIFHNFIDCKTRSPDTSIFIQISPILWEFKNGRRSYHKDFG